jgi:hypothetical protein
MGQELLQLNSKSPPRSLDSLNYLMLNKLAKIVGLNMFGGV